MTNKLEILEKYDNIYEVHRHYGKGKTRKIVISDIDDILKKDEHTGFRVEKDLYSALSEIGVMPYRVTDTIKTIYITKSNMLDIHNKYVDPKVTSPYDSKAEVHNYLINYRTDYTFVIDNYCFNYDKSAVCDWNDHVVGHSETLKVITKKEYTSSTKNMKMYHKYPIWLVQDDIHGLSFMSTEDFESRYKPYLSDEINDKLYEIRTPKVLSNKILECTDVELLRKCEKLLQEM